MLKHAPKTVKSRHRLYTTGRERREIETTPTPYGRGTPVQVGLVTVDRSPDWGTYSEGAAFYATLGYYGEVRIPKAVRDRLDLDVGDAVRLSLART